jgi:uncharacterized delta-60 repeat protein
MKRSIAFIVIRVLAIVCLAGSFLVTTAGKSAAAGSAGELDAMFGTAGLVTTSLQGDAVAEAAVVQQDGKILVAGYSGIGTATNFTLVRYDSQGMLDPSFGTGGVVTTVLGQSSAATSLAVQPDGKIVVAGSVVVGIQPDFGLVRYDQDGSVDGTFGDGGMVTTDFGSNELAVFVAVQPDGKIVAAGGADEGGVLAKSFSVARYNPDGSLDTTFGSGGKTSANFASFGERAEAAALQPDGKIVVAGNALLGVWQDFAVVRFNGDGSLDGTFGSGGKVTTDFEGQGDLATSVAIQPDGKILAAGGAGFPAGGQAGFGLVRYNTDGSLDGMFGTGGKVMTDFGVSGDGVEAIVLQPDGKVIAVGQTTTPTFTGDFALARYNANGTLDTSFGTGGLVTTDFAGGSDVANGVALQSDGNVVSVGASYPANGVTVFALARHLGSSGEALTIISNTRLTQDHLGSIVIAANNVTLDCAGHTITGPGDVGVRVESRSWVTVKNCNVTGFDQGILVQDSERVRLVRNRLFDNGIGIHFGASRFNHLELNRVEGNTSWAGLLLEGSNSNTLMNNKVDGTGGGHGIYLTESDANIFLWNTVTSNGASGILFDTSDANSVRCNTFSGNSWAGVVLLGSAHNRIEANRSEGNGGGFWLWSGSTSNTLIGNSAVGNGGSGFDLEEESNNNVIVGNTAQQNAERGFLLVTASTNTLRANRAIGNGAEGFILFGSNDNVLSKNRSTDNGSPGAYAGFALLESSTGNQLTGNIANGNGDVGLVLEGSSANTLWDNVANANGITGIELRSSSDANRIEGNLVVGNGTDGFRITDSNSNLIKSNVSKLNGGIGFHLMLGSLSNKLLYNLGLYNLVFDASDENAAGLNTWKDNHFGTINFAA